MPSGERAASIPLFTSQSWDGFALYHLVNGASAAAAYLVVKRIDARLVEVERRQARVAPVTA